MAELIEKQEADVGESKITQRSRSGFWFGVIILLIIVGIAGAGFYLFQQLRSQQQDLGGEVNKGDMQVIELSKQISGYQSQLVAIQSQLATIEKDIAGKNTHFTKTLADFSQLHNEKLDTTRKELNSAIQQVQRQLGKTRGDWLIADAEYLLSVANERLHLIGDVNTTREALEAADQRLKESGDAGVFKVREQIANEIAALRTTDMPDIVGIYSAIKTLQDHVEKLDLLLPYSGKALTPSSAEATSPSSPTDTDNAKKTHDMLDSALDELHGIVTIRRSDQPIKEILTPEEAQFIREQLRVKLEMVKITLVQQNEPLFQASVDDTKKWAEQHFNQNKDAGNFIAELDRVRTIKIRSQFPDISGSLKMLRDISKLRIEADKAMQPDEEVKPVEAVPEKQQ
ncbi:MAG: uroporphyrinogen-III C-methyltransferase [Methylobacter sp.]|nr:uroporphyrinogen-III C-methyltransferase [Methylobacter sp.]